MLKRIESFTSLVAACLLFLLMIVTFIDVVGRNFFNRPLVGASEMTEVMLAAIIFLLLPSVAFRQEHIVVDLIDAFAGKVLLLVQKVLTALIGGLLFGLIGWRLWVLGSKAAGYADATPSLGIPLAPVIYAMSVLAFVTALTFLGLLLRPTRLPESAELAAAKRMAESDVAPAEASPRPLQTTSPER